MHQLLGIPPQFPQIRRPAHQAEIENNAPIFSGESIRRLPSPIVDTIGASAIKEFFAPINAPKELTSEKTTMIETYNQTRYNFETHHRALCASCGSLSRKLRSQESKYTVHILSK